MTLWRSTLGLLVLVVAPACRQILDIEERPVERIDAGSDAGFDASTCPYVFAAPVASGCWECVRDSCCAALAACQREPACIACVQGQPGSCVSAGSFGALEVCVEDSCSKECALESPFVGTPECLFPPAQPVDDSCFVIDDTFDHAHCNLISNEGCEPGEVCAFSGSGYTVDCRVSAHHVTCGQACGLLHGACGQGLVCVASEEVAIAGVCGRWCCPGDCGVAGVCEVPELYAANVGVCFEK